MQDAETLQRRLTLALAHGNELRVTMNAQRQSIDGYQAAIRAMENRLRIHKERVAELEEMNRHMKRERDNALRMWAACQEAIKHSEQRTNRCTWLCAVAVVMLAVMIVAVLS
jgi:hypothetical protein